MFDLSYEYDDDERPNPDNIWLMMSTIEIDSFDKLKRAHSTLSTIQMGSFCLSIVLWLYAPMLLQNEHFLQRPIQMIKEIVVKFLLDPLSEICTFLLIQFER